MIRDTEEKYLLYDTLIHNILHTIGGKGYGGKTLIHGIYHTLGGKGYGGNIINV